MLYPLFGSPRLPKTEKSQQRKIDLSGTVVRFSVPPYSAKWGTGTEHSSHFNLYDQNEYLLPDEKFPFIECFRTRWDILGTPVIQSKRGWIRLSVSILKMKENSNNSQNKEFEGNLKHFYITQYGPKSANRNSFETLLDWSGDNINSQAWAHYRILENSDDAPSHTLMWEAPITNQHILSFSFYYQNFPNCGSVHNAVKSFAQKIMHSVHVELSPSAQQQKEAAEKQWPGQRYSEHMEPLRWIRPKKDFMSIEEFLAEDDEP